MASGDTASRSMRRYLLWWICGSGVALVLCYTVLIELYLDADVRLRAGNDLERVAADYAARYATDSASPAAGGPAHRGLPAVRGTLPRKRCARLFPAGEYRLGEIVWAYPDGAGWQSRALGGILPACEAEETPCEALLLYSHRLDGGEWLYLLQGLAVSPADGCRPGPRRERRAGAGRVPGRGAGGR